MKNDKDKHDAVATKSKGKMAKFKNAEDRLRAFIQDFIENLDTMRAEAGKPDVTKDQILAEVDDAVANFKANVEVIVQAVTKGV